MFELIIVWFLPSVLSPERQVRICWYNNKPSHSFDYHMACREFFGRLCWRWMTLSKDPLLRIQLVQSGVQILTIINFPEYVSHILAIWSISRQLGPSKHTM
jgi:hypothetical protein